MRDFGLRYMLTAYVPSGWISLLSVPLKTELSERPVVLKYQR